MYIDVLLIYFLKGNVKFLPYSLPSVGSGAAPGLQVVSLHVTSKSSLAVGCHYFPPGFPAVERHSPLTSKYQAILLGDRGTQV